MSNTSTTKRYLVTDPCYFMIDEVYHHFLDKTDGEVDEFQPFIIHGFGKVLMSDSCEELDIKVGKRADGVAKEMMSDSGLMCVVELEDDAEINDNMGTAVTKNKDTAVKWFNKFIEASNRW